MEHIAEDYLLKKVIQSIEEKLQWGNSKQWTTSDFQTLSDKIFDYTGVVLSVTTLKRLWGKVRYDSKPNPATLNALAQFLDYPSWQNYCAITSKQAEQARKVRIPSIRFKRSYVFMTVALITCTWLLLTFKPHSSDPENDDYTFTLKKMVRNGVPNTVIFEYDASAADGDDTILVQQSWDKRLQTQVSREAKVHHSIYYFPGFYRAKLLVNGDIVREHPLLISSDEWIVGIEQEGIPVYFQAPDFLKEGKLGIDTEQIINKNIALQPVAPWVHYSYIRSFEDLYTDNFTFETLIKNDYSTGSSVCQFSQVHIAFEGGVFIIPLSSKGCVSGLELADSKGVKSDPSGLGVDFSSWVKIQCTFNNRNGELFINDAKVYDVSLDFSPQKIIGVKYRFQGTGSVKSVCFKDRKGGVVFNDNFSENTIAQF